MKHIREYRGPRAINNRWGWQAVIRLLGLVGSGKNKKRDICEEFNIKYDAAGRILKRLVGLKLIHVAGWEKSEARSIPLEIYAFGPGVNVPRPPNVNGELSRHKAVTGSPQRLGGDLIALAHVIRTMQEPCTMREIAEITGVCQRHLSSVMRWMREARIAYISGYEPRLYGGSMSILFAIGLDMPDAPHPSRRPANRKDKRERHYSQRSITKQRDRRAHMQLLMATAGCAA